MGVITRAKLLRFVKRRNKSGFDSNLQFGIDADACGIPMEALRGAEKFRLDGFTGYQWKVPLKEGTARMVEYGRRLYLEGEDDVDTMFLFTILDRAQFVQPEPANAEKEEVQ